MTGASTEQSLLDAVERRREDLIELARALVATPSPNPPGDQLAVADLLTAELRRLGIAEIERLAAEPKRPNLVARLRSGEPGRRLAYNGHIDTKPPGDLSRWETDPFDPVIVAGDLHGLGAVDMKGALAAMVYAAAALSDVDGWVGELDLIFSADEEAPGHGANWLSTEGLVEADAIVIGEPCGISRDWESLHVVSRGAALFRIRVRGTPMHSSLSDLLPSVNATVEMARLIVRMHESLRSDISHPPHPLGLHVTTNIGVTAQAGVFYGVYPGEAEFCCDVRTLPGMTRDDFVRDVERFLAEAAGADPDLDAGFQLDGWFPATEISPDHPVVDALLQASRLVLGDEPPLGAFPASSDAVHFQGTAGIPTVPSFGPGSLARAHNPNEYVSVSSLIEAAKIYALAAYSYLGARS